MTYNRLVNSIDKLLDLNCFDPHDLGTVDDEEHETVLTGNFMVKQKAGRSQSTKKLQYFATESTLLPPGS